MIKTLKIRKGPSDSATKFKVGTKKKGNDGNMWKIVENKNGTKRWLKISNKFNKSNKSNNITSKASVQKSTDVSVEMLKKMKEKYKVTSHGSKKDMALGIWRVRSSAISTKDLKLIIHLLPKDDQKKAEKLIKHRTDKPITNYKGMWKPKPKPLNKMSRDELIRNLRSFRNAWERITMRHQDLSNERLAEEDTKSLQRHLKYYYSDEARLIAEEWLRKS